MSAPNWRNNLVLVWEGDCPEGVDAKVRAELVDELDSLLKPEDLIFHTVLLADMDGPCVMVWGVEGDARFHAEYHAESEWATLSGEQP